MLTNFHFDEDFLSSDDIVSSHSAVVNSLLLKFWFENGCLIYPYTKKDLYKQWLQYIPPKYSIKWEAALVNNLTSDMNKGYEKLSDYKNIAALAHHCLTTQLDLVIAPNEFNKFGLTEENDIVSSTFDLCKSSGILQAPSVVNNEKLRNRGMLPTDKIEEVWNSQFRKIASHSKVITIIDRYFGENLYKDAGSRLTALEKFLIFLKNEKKSYSITIYTVGGERNSDLHNFIDNFGRKLVAQSAYASSITMLNIHSCKDEVFRDYSHERYLCFDSFVYKVDRGMEIFREFPPSATSITICRKQMSETFNFALKKLTSNREW